MKKLFYGNICFWISIVFSLNVLADYTIVANKVNNAPKIDGIVDPLEWAAAVPITVCENVGQIKISLKAVYTDQEICFLVTFPDNDESRNHRNLVWDKEKKMYMIGPDREDSFVFKWSMEPEIIDLSIYADNPYRADIWYWKACRTDPVGYADDKICSLSLDKLPQSSKIISKKGYTFYSKRSGDKGTSAYIDGDIPLLHGADKISMFKNVVPTGSRADVVAKGQWKEKQWTIEFKRLLFTGNIDDIQFSLSESYQFGIARY
ncbi:MAG: hypothetical protein HQK75_14310, partial [Candidatus Magnetomorum sp.]|nr:hypothetical protein [Candidatus Magnetomorum sp.]